MHQQAAAAVVALATAVVAIVVVSWCILFAIVNMKYFCGNLRLEFRVNLSVVNVTVLGSTCFDVKFAGFSTSLVEN